MTSVLELYRSLPTPEGELFAVGTHPEHNDVFIGKDADGGPAVILKRAVTGGASLPVVLRNAILLPTARVSIRRGEVEEEIDAAVYRCRAVSTALREYFIVAVAGIVSALLLAGTFDAAAVLRLLAELFHQLEQPATRSLQGLWGELFVIIEGTSPTTLLDAWHTDPYEHFDFARGPERIEVKTCTSPLRQHHFNLTQLRPAAPTKSYIASLMCSRSAGGDNLYDLLDEVRLLATTPAQRVKLELLVASVIRDDMDITDIRYDREHARTSLRYFRAEDVPSVSRDLPNGVTNVHFDAVVPDALAIATPPTDTDALMAAAWQPR